MTVAGLTTIEISYSSRSATGTFRALLRIGSRAGLTVTIDDPGGPAFEELLTWYYEVLPSFPLGRPAKRERAEKEIQDYSRALYNQVFGSRDAIRALEPYRRTGFRNCCLVVSGDREFHRLRWELMHESGAPEPLSVQMPFQRGILDQVSDVEQGGSRPSLNVLVVTARPLGADDLDYRSVTRVLLAESWNTELPFRVDVVRPGTWRALSRHLRERENVYQVIHFDLHGMIGVAAQLDRRDGMRLAMPADRGSGATSAFLLFESEEPGSSDLVPASAVARLLAANHIPIAVLNACRSAEVPAGEPSLAEWLAQYGVRAVVGMAYPVTPDTVSRAMPVLYKEIARGASPAEAVRRCRKELLGDPLRELSPGVRLPLEDWSAPVIYQQPEPLDLHLREMTEPEREEHFRRQAEAGPEPAEVMGRAHDVFAVERLMTSDEARTILVHGPADVGKTWFVTRLMRWWWLRTGSVERAAVVTIHAGRVNTIRDIVHHLARDVLTGAEFCEFEDWSWDAQRERVARRLRAQPHLVMIDSGADELPNRRELREFLHQAGHGRSLIVVTSRDEEAALADGTFGDRRYLLRPPHSDSSPPSAEPEEEPPPTPPVPPNGRRRSTVWATAAAGVLVLVVAATLLANLGDRAGPPSDPGAQPTTAVVTGFSRPTAEPDWMAAPQIGGVSITSPAAGQTTKSCVTVSGTATGLAEGQVVLLAIRKVAAVVPEYFYWGTKLTGATWTAEVTLGVGNWQEYVIHALVADGAAVEKAAESVDGTFTSRIPIDGLRRGADVRIEQNGRC